jgi:hypothetical protein
MRRELLSAALVVQEVAACYQAGPMQSCMVRSTKRTPNCQWSLIPGATHAHHHRSTCANGLIGHMQLCMQFPCTFLQLKATQLLSQLNGTSLRYSIIYLQLQSWPPTVLPTCDMFKIDRLIQFLLSDGCPPLLYV